MGDLSTATNADASRSQQIMDAILLALGCDAKYFDISMSDILVDEPDVLSALIQFSPRVDADLEDALIIGSDIHLQFDLVDGDPQLILGEDEEHEITKGNLYASLYWGEVCKCKSDLAAPGGEAVAWRPKLAQPIPYVTGMPRESDLMHWEESMGVEIEYAYAAQPAVDGAVLTAHDLDLIRQWYNALSDMDSSGYLNEKDRATYEKVKAAIKGEG